MRRLITLSLIVLSFGSLAQIQEQKDNPQARLEFEFLRTKNPITNQVPRDIRLKEKLLMDARQAELKSNNRIAVPSITWTNRGPYNVGGRTRALAIDVSDLTESTILAGGISGGLWRTTNDGVSWNKVTTTTDLQSISCIAQDTRSGQEATWYYGTGEFTGNSAGGSGAPYRGDGIFKSTDGGSTWSVLESTDTGIPQTFDSDFDYNHEIVVNPTNGDVIVANYGGIYRSQNGGTSFSKVFGTPNGWTDVAVTSTGILYAFLEADGIYQSTDDGDTWNDISDAGQSFASGERYEIAIAPSDEDIVYVLGEDATHSSGHALWKYDDSGLGSWDDRSDNIPQLGGQTGDFTTQGGYDVLIKVKNNDADFVVIGGTNLFSSSDGFNSTNNTTWIGGYTSSNSSYALYPNHHPDQHSFIFLAGDRAYSGNDGGVQLTSDVTSGSVAWTPLNNGYLTSQIYAVSAGPEDQLLIGLQDNGTWLATNTTGPTDEWTDPFGGDGAYSAISNDGTVRYMSSQNANIGLFTYSDAEDVTASAGWVFVPSAANGYSTQLFITPFYLDPNDNNLFYLGGDNELWVNTQAISAANQAGSNVGWKAINLSGASGVVSEIGVGGANVVYAGTSSGNIVKITNPGASSPTVENVTGASFPGGYVSGIGVSPTNSDKVIVSFSNYGIPSVFYSEDGGDTWSDVSGNLEENPDGTGNGSSVRVARIHGNATRFFVGTSTGLYSTELLDGTSTVWIREDETGIGSTVVEHMVTRLDGLVVAATHGNGVFSADVPLNDTDLLARSIDEPETSVFTSSSTNVLASIQNIGSLTIDDFDMVLYVNDQLIVSDNVTQSMDNGEIYQHTFSQSVDFTSIEEYTIRVEVEVSGDEDEDTNDVSKQILSLAVPIDITLSNNTIAEGETPGTTIGTFEASDEDDETHTFSFTSGSGSDDNSDFRIAGTQLVAGAVFDFSDKSVYTIRIQAQDDDGNSFARSFEINISDVLAVEEWEKAGITVYPNPSKGRVTMEMINDFVGDVRIKVLSIDGKEVLVENTYPKLTKSTRSLLDISSLNKGTYFVIFNFGGKEITSKLIKE